MAPNRTVTVFGAYGHTGTFVVSEFRRRGWTVVLSGRDPDKLKALGSHHPDTERRPASIDDPASLDRALTGATAVVNCAGPFLKTSDPVIEAALRARISYLDVAAELEVVAGTYERHDEPARQAGIAIMPAMAFYGGLGDLLATAAMGDWESADEVNLAYALSSWKPTLGTRAAGRSNVALRGEGRRPVLSLGRIEYRTDRAPTHDWTFPAPFGTQTVVTEYTTAASLAISRHLEASEIRSCMTLKPLKDLSDPDLAPPAAVDDSGRSSQIFLVEAVARKGRAERRAVASGRDIYAISAPIVAEAAERIVGRSTRPTGVLTAGEIFDARDFLASLASAQPSFDFH